MPEPHPSFTGPLLSLFNLLVSALAAGGLLWLTQRVNRRFQPFTSALISLACLFASAVPISLAQLIFPRLSPALATLTPLLMVATGALVGTVRFARARYSEEVQSQGLLLVVLTLVLSLLLLLDLLPLLGPRDAFALGTAGALIGALTIIPHRYLRSVMGRCFTRHLAQPAKQRPIGPSLRAALSCALLGIGGLAFLWHAGHLGFLIHALPGAGAISAWMLVADAFACWLTIPRPLPAYVLTGAASAAHPLDDESSS